jgi:hypothetical protein
VNARLPALQRVDLHEQDVVGHRLVVERVQGRIAHIAAVPIGHAVDFHRLEDRGQAGGGHEVIGREFLSAEDRNLAGPDIGRADEDLDIGAGAHAIKVDERVNRVPQRIDVERVGLVRTETSG